MSCCSAASCRQEVLVPLHCRLRAGGVAVPLAHPGLQPSVQAPPRRHGDDRDLPPWRARRRGTVSDARSDLRRRGVIPDGGTQAGVGSRLARGLLPLLVAIHAPAGGLRGARGLQGIAPRAAAGVARGASDAGCGGQRPQRGAPTRVQGRLRGALLGRPCGHAVRRGRGELLRSLGPPGGAQRLRGRRYVGGIAGCGRASGRCLHSEWRDRHQPNSRRRERGAVRACGAEPGAADLRHRRPGGASGGFRPGLRGLVHSQQEARVSAGRHS
mmetsp:Transcript_45151/g.129532  ORF Transcript_45151/g.129532 Transcript_45151/m.129532 type:complete len:270 (+) Transcript_45151:90-899(+)